MKHDDDDRQFALATAHAAVELDVAGTLGSFLEGSFSVDESIGESTWRSETSQFFAVRWRFEGKHVGQIPGFGHTYIAATHNMVSVSGLTLVENTAPDDSALDDLETLLRSGKAQRHPLRPTRSGDESAPRLQRRTSRRLTGGLPVECFTAPR